MQITLNIVLAVFIALIIFIIANFLGLLEGRGQGYKKRQKEEAEQSAKIKEVEAPLPHPDPIAAKPENNLLKLSLANNNQPSLELDGQVLEINKITPAQRKRLVDLMVILRPWIEVPAAARPATQTPAPSKPVAPISAPRTPPIVAPVSTPRPTPPPPPTPKPLFGIPAIQPKKEDAAPTSMVGQIEAILQEKLIGTPFADQGIHLVESAEGGVNVTIGSDQYDGIADVPDANVIKMIRAAVAEWEKKYTPG